MGDAGAGTRAARGKRTIRRRAVGTRDRIVSHLTAVGDIADVSGMASTKLAEAVGYPGSSVAFAQLLSGMERDGLIVREVRGKRTYRITLPDTARGDLPPAPVEEASVGFDYDELARRLLVQVVRKLASGSVTDADLDMVDAPSALAERASARASASEGRGGEAVAAELQETVASLERELATAWTRHGTLTAENARLREELSQAQRDLALERTRRVPLSGEFNQAEVGVLEQLLDTPDTA